MQYASTNQESRRKIDWPDRGVGTISSLLFFLLLFGRFIAEPIIFLYLMEKIDQNYLHGLMTSGLSDREISVLLSQSYPDSGGFSERSLRRWRNENGVKKRDSFSDTDVERHVRNAVGNIGVDSGRRFVKGYLESLPNPVSISEPRISHALKVLYPAHHRHRRRQVLQRLNPVAYHADYFGHRLHIDQNEKVVAFGVTHVVAIDGYSGYVVAHVTMPLKNNIIIYDSVFREALLQFGLWDQLVVDHGGEFHLTLSGQNFFKDYRSNTSRAPYLEIASTKNNRVERVWVEVNQRVNYPVKESLQHLVDQGIVDPGDQSHRFIVSEIGQQVTRTGMKKLFDARNSRHCRGRGVPTNLMLQNYGCAELPNGTHIPTGAEAATSYRANGSILTDPYSFGLDSLANRPALQQRRREAFAQYRFSIDEIYGLLACHNATAFEGFVTYALGVDRRLANMP